MFYEDAAEIRRNLTKSISLLAAFLCVFGHRCHVHKRGWLHEFLRPWLFFACFSNVWICLCVYQFVTLTKVEKLSFSFSFISFVGSSCVHGHHSTLYGGVHICTWLSVLKRRLLVPSVACRSCLDPLWAQSKASSAGPFFSLSSSGKWLTECR